MLKTISTSLLTHLLFTGMLSCAYDKEEELFGSSSCNPGEITYEAVIRPLLTEFCNIPDCHDGSNPAISNWGVFENVQMNANSIKEHTADRSMPPTNSGKILSTAQISDIACWVENGAHNN